MKWHDLQRQSSIIHTRLFVYGDQFPPVKGVQQDAHIHGYQLIVQENNKPATLYETNDWQDTVQGTLITELTESQIDKAKTFYEGKSLVVMPVLCKTVRIEAQIFV